MEAPTEGMERRRTRSELVVGLALAVGLVAGGGVLGVRAFARLGPAGRYDVSADFVSAGGLRTGAPVEIAGVSVGTVAATSLRDGEAHVVLRLQSSVRVPADSTAAISTDGLVGERYVAIEPGHAHGVLRAGDRFRHTTPAIDLEDAIAAAIFGKVS
jgi:phospholipid/cholesterol/gamma-HCH transport system substrate-binding protein